MLIDKNAIQQAKETLGDRNAELIQDLLHMDKYDERRRVGCCPDPNHMDDTPSCSYNPKTYSFKCFGCSFHADLLDALMIKTGCSFAEACQKLFEYAGMEYDFAEKGVLTGGRGYKYPKPVYAQNKSRVYEYWKTRGISPETVDYLNMQEDTNGNTLFQYFDLNDVLVTVKVRPSHAVKKGDTKIWCLPGSDHTNALFNMNKINTTQPLILTSGEGDCATCIECGVMNAVSEPWGDGNDHWIAENWDWLQQFSEIILVHDNDEAGEKFAKNVSTRLGEYRIKIADVPTVHALDDGTKIKVKDLNELLFYEGKDAVREVIKTARDSEIPAVVDYADVKQFDMSEVGGFTSGLTDLDNALMKFYFGSVTVLTGTTGSGKSSLLSTLICQSADQDCPVFVYSGELSNPALKNWVDCVHAGRRGMNQYCSQTGKPYYKVRPDVYAQIGEEYRGKIFFYKDSIDQTVSKILSTAESVVRKYNVKTLVFDNMTSIDLENTDDNKWIKQDEFVKAIIAFAKRWNVCCIVVLHPKKMDMNRRMTIYDLSGISTAATLTHRVLALYRVPDKEKMDKLKKDGTPYEKGCPFDVTIEVLKDRFGSAGGKTAGLFYDTVSRRFYDTIESLDHRYAWDKHDYSGVAIPYPEVTYQDTREVFGDNIPT